MKEAFRKAVAIAPLLPLFLTTSTSVSAQERHAAWQEAWNDLADDLREESEEDGTLDEDTYDLLWQLAEHPIDLNRATRDDLERLPFLSAQQVMDLMEYLDRYGPMRSLGELRMVASLDYRQLRLLPFFVCISQQQDTVRFPSLRQIAGGGRHTLTASARLPLYDRKGDRNGYLGYKYRHWLRYEFGYGDYVRMGLMGAQDAGEPFFSNRNKWGYDVYNYYLQMSKLGPVETAVVGRYKLSTGMGLVLNNSFSLGKQMTLQNLGRPTRSLRPHTSRSATDYYQGAAATVRLWPSLSATPFVSYRQLDATLNSDGTARTIVSTGYHRTPTEMGKKNNTHAADAGLNLSFRKNGIHLGLTGVCTWLDRELSPDQSALFRRYYPRGRRFMNASADYGITRHHVAFSGETAIDGDAHMATIHAVSFQPSARLALMALHRFYSYRYTTLHGHAFGEGSSVRNESGLYVGATWQMLSRLTLSAYADFAYFPWARYQVSQSSTVQDYFAEMTWTPLRHLTVKGRYRLHRKEKDNSDKTALLSIDEHRARLSVAYDDGEQWSTRTQIDLSGVENGSTETGFMLSQRVDWKHRWLSLGMMAGWFDTPSYATRIYVYERQLPHEYAFPMYYGRGVRLSLLARADVGRTLQLNVRAGHTWYADRNTIGTGLQQIDAPRATDVELQLRLRTGR